jgi:acetyl esterase
VTLDPDPARFLEQLGGFVPVPPPLDDADAVAAFLAGLGAADAGSLLGGELESVAHVEDCIIPTSDAMVPVRVYRPSAGPRPIVVFLHGGVFVIGGLEMHDHVLRRLANSIPAVIVSVDYRLAPRHPFPAAVDDAFAVVVWAATHSEQLGGDPRRVVVMGDSAGGALAAVVAIRARDQGSPELKLQVLVYPMVDPALAPDSTREFADGYLTTTALLNLGWHVYRNGHNDEPYTAPSATADLWGVPPAIVLTAECDPLRDGGLDYIRRLCVANVPVMAENYRGQIHGFAFMPAAIPAANEALADLVSRIRNAVGPL